MEACPARPEQAIVVELLRHLRAAGKGLSPFLFFPRGCGKSGHKSVLLEVL